MSFVVWRAKRNFKYREKKCWKIKIFLFGVLSIILHIGVFQLSTSGMLTSLNLFELTRKLIMRLILKKNSINSMQKMLKEMINWFRMNLVFQALPLSSKMIMNLRMTKKPKFKSKWKYHLAIKSGKNPTNNFHNMKHFVSTQNSLSLYL